MQRTRITILSTFLLLTFSACSDPALQNELADTKSKLAAAQEKNQTLLAEKQELETKLKRIQYGQSEPRPVHIITDTGKQLEGAELILFHPYPHWPQFGKDFREQPLEIDSEGIRIQVRDQDLFTLEVKWVEERKDQPAIPGKSFVRVRTRKQSYEGLATAASGSFYLSLPDNFPVSSLNEYFNASAGHPYHNPEVRKRKEATLLRVPIHAIRKIQILIDHRY